MQMLPEDIRTEIITHLDPLSQFSMRHVNKNWYRRLQELNPSYAVYAKALLHLSCYWYITNYRHGSPYPEDIKWIKELEPLLMYAFEPRPNTIRQVTWMK